MLRKSLYVVSYLAMAAASLKTCSVSMQEPFQTIRFHDILWQYAVPIVVTTLASAVAASGVFAFLDQRISARQLLFTFALLSAPLALSLEAIYGYTWDLYYHAGIRWHS